MSVDEVYVGKCSYFYYRCKNSIKPVHTIHLKILFCSVRPWLKVN